MLFNAALLGLVVALFSARFDSIDKRFDDMRICGERSFGGWKKCSMRG